MGHALRLTACSPGFRCPVLSHSVVGRGSSAEQAPCSSSARLQLRQLDLPCWLPEEQLVSAEAVARRRVALHLLEALWSMHPAPVHALTQLLVQLYSCSSWP